MGVSIKKVVCFYCRGEVKETYRHSTWKSVGECGRCGTRWEKQFDEYDLSNMKVKRAYGAVIAWNENEVIEIDRFYEQPTPEEAIERLNQMSSTYSHIDSCFAIFEAEGKWIKRYVDGTIEDVL